MIYDNFNSFPTGTFFLHLLGQFLVKSSKLLCYLYRGKNVFLFSQFLCHILGPVFEFLGTYEHKSVIVSSVRVNGKIDVRIYKPTSANNCAMLYIHGGGFCILNAKLYEIFCKFVAEYTNMVIVSVDYDLAPQNPFPCALNQCQEILQWMNSNSKSIGIDANKIIVGGDSAGGNLSAALCLKLKQEDSPLKIRAQILLNPILDLKDLDTPSMFANEYGPFLTRGMCYDFQGFYTLKGQEVHPWASPQFADNHSGLPQAVIVVSEKDPLFSTGMKYYETLKKAGVGSELILFKNAWHVQFIFTFLPESAKQATEISKSILKIIETF